MNFNWITLTVILVVAICIVALAVILPRIGLYTVLFNLQHVPPKAGFSKHLIRLSASQLEVGAYI